MKTCKSFQIMKAWGECSRAGRFGPNTAKMASFEFEISLEVEGLLEMY